MNVGSQTVDSRRPDAEGRRSPFCLFSLASGQRLSCLSVTSSTYVTWQGCGRPGCSGAAAPRPLEDLSSDRGQENRAVSPRRKAGAAAAAKQHACCGCRPSVHAEAAMTRVKSLQDELREQARQSFVLAGSGGEGCGSADVIHVGKTARIPSRRCIGIGDVKHAVLSRAPHLRGNEACRIAFRGSASPLCWRTEPCGRRTQRPSPPQPTRSWPSSWHAWPSLKPRCCGRPKITSWVRAAKAGSGSHSVETASFCF